MRPLSTLRFSDSYELYEFVNPHLSGESEKLTTDRDKRAFSALSIEETTEEKPNIAENIPIGIFIMVLGTASQGLLYQRLDDSLHKMGKNTLLQGFELLYVAKLFYSLASLIFFLCCAAYIYKMIFAFSAVKKECISSSSSFFFSFLSSLKNRRIGPVETSKATFLKLFVHKTQKGENINTRNQFGMFSMSVILLATSALRNVEILGQIGLFAGAFLHTLISVELVGNWITKKRNFETFNPTYFTPVAGLSLISGPAWRLGWHELAWLYLGVALVYWMLLFTILLVRLIFHDPLVILFLFKYEKNLILCFSQPPHLTPTLFMAFAPPSLLYNAYVVISGQKELDNFGRILFATALFTVVLGKLTKKNSFSSKTQQCDLVFRARLVIKGMGFSLTWFAYTFPLNGFAIAVVSFHEQIMSKVTMVLCLFAAFGSFFFWLIVSLSGYSFILFLCFDNIICLILFLKRIYWLFSGHILKLLKKKKQ